MSLAILGMGTALPDTVVTQQQSAEIAGRICPAAGEHDDFLGNLYRQTTIEARHLAFEKQVIDDIVRGTRTTGSPFLPGKSEGPGPTTAERMSHYSRYAGPLAVRAAAHAIDEARISPSAITHLVTVSCTGFQSPGVDLELVQALELSRSVERTHVGFMGCHGALNGLRVARAYADSLAGSLVLLCAVELCSLHYYYGWSARHIVANALFADGAAALVGAPGRHGLACWQAAASGSHVFPNSESAMTWNVGNHGFEMTLSTKVPELIARGLAGWLKPWLASHGLSIETVPTWAIHPGGPRILLAVEESLLLSRSQTSGSWSILARHGNMSSPTVLFVIDELRGCGAPRPCVALAFGPGLTVEAAIFA